MLCYVMFILRKMTYVKYDFNKRQFIARLLFYCLNFIFIDNVVRAAFLCKHVRLSRVCYNKLTYLLNFAFDTVSWVSGRASGL